MKTAKGSGNVAVRDVPEPTPGEGDVLIRVQVAGVCGTDLHIYYDRFPNSPPVILGHEFSGVVERVGRGVKNVKAGDRVVSENNPFACGKCRICSLGYPNMCTYKRAMGIHSDGCFADYVRLPAKLLNRIPESVSFEEAALMEPLAVAVHAVDDRCGIKPGDNVVVLGPGAIGLLAAQVARAKGAHRVVVAGTAKDAEVRLVCATKLGFETCNVESENLTDKVMALTGGEGVDVVIEASGAKRAIDQGIIFLRRGGRMGILGITGTKEVPVDWDGMVGKGLSLLFCYSSRKRNWQKGLKYLAEKKVETLPLITHRLMIDQWQEAFSALETFESIRSVFQIGCET